jgi:hypothetical protein
MTRARPANFSRRNLTRIAWKRGAIWPVGRGGAIFYLGAAAPLFFQKRGASFACLGAVSGATKRRRAPCCEHRQSKNEGNFAHVKGSAADRRDRLFAGASTAYAADDAPARSRPSTQMRRAVGKWRPIQRRPPSSCPTEVGEKVTFDSTASKQDADQRDQACDLTLAGGSQDATGRRRQAGGFSRFDIYPKAKAGAWSRDLTSEPLPSRNHVAKAAAIGAPRLTGTSHGSGTQGLRVQHSLFGQLFRRLRLRHASFWLRAIRTLLLRRPFFSIPVTVA